MWMPIETAPDDGTVILVFTRDGEITTANYNDDDRGWMTGLTGYPWTRDMFSHWMPLPEPPVDD